MTTGRAILVSLVLALSAFVGARADDWGSRIVVAARSQVGVTTRYVPDYRVIAYPNGVVPIKEGVCTDVVIRALRTALGIDLQRLVHEDMAAHFSSYPTIWQRKSPDSNIDHRRVQNLRVFFRRRGWELPAHSPYLPGDFVTCTLPGNHDHIMVVSDRNSSGGRPLVVHNIGSGAREEDCLTLFHVTGHYRAQRQASARKGRR
jgi:uncharacterized protein YijF (DUF1287 family)